MSGKMQQNFLTLSQNFAMLHLVHVVNFDKPGKLVSCRKHGLSFMRVSGLELCNLHCQKIALL
jgi:hypothetical protein